jgi:hypothetical protein
VAKHLQASIENFVVLEFSSLSLSDAVEVFQRRGATLIGELVYSESIFRSHFFNTAWLQNSVVLMTILDTYGVQGLSYFILFSNWRWRCRKSEFKLLVKKNWVDRRRTRGLLDREARSAAE